MTQNMLRYVLRGIVYYRGVNLAVLLAVAVATTVIAGALIVGDSVRSSLRDMTLQRLGGISHALHSPRFFTQQLAVRLYDPEESLSESTVCAPALLLTASIVAKPADDDATTDDGQASRGVRRRAGSVILLAIDDAGWSLLDTGKLPAPGDRGVVLGYRTAKELDVAAGSVVSLWVELPSTIPRDSLLGEREELVREIELTVEAVLDEDEGASRFSLNPSQHLPHNAFMSLSTLQARLSLDEVVASRRNPVSHAARVNTLLVGQPLQNAPAGRSTDRSIEEDDQRLEESLTRRLSEGLRLDDIGLRLRPIYERGYLSAESDSMILEDSIADAVASSAERLGMTARPVQVYLANEIWAADRADNNERYSMYSIVAGMDFDQSPPLGPITFGDGNPGQQLKDDEIVLSAWLAEDLHVSIGDQVQIRWHEVGSHGDLPEVVHSFQVRGVLAADNMASLDPDLTPFVDGVTNVDSFGDWNQPFEMEMDRITERDDLYWEAHHATPKAFVSRAMAGKLWSSRFGRYTSVRLASEGVTLPAERLHELAGRLKRDIPTKLRPLELGLVFQPVRVMGLQAAVGANDFSGLFLGFSFFLILSAILLASLMFQLGIQRRVDQIGLLQAVGFTRWATRRVFLGEGIIVAVSGAILGAVGGVFFGKLMILGLTTWWVGAVGTQFLHLDVQPARVATAVSISVGLAIAVIGMALIRSTRRSPRELLAGEFAGDDITQHGRFRRFAGRLAFIVSIACAIGLPVANVAEFIPSSEAFGGLSWPVISFFVAGFACLFAGLTLLGRQLQRRVGETIDGTGGGGLTRLAVANASRSASRSLLTTALIAFATFVIVAVAAGRRNPVSETPDRNSGNGGFSLVAESSQPILFDINTASGKARLGLDRDDATTLPEDVKVFGFSMKPGQDASCLNLYQATVPTLLGAAPAFLDRGGFRFADTPGENPWQKLKQSLPDVDGIPAVPVIGDLNTLQFSLKKGIGDSVMFPNASQPQFALQIVGMLDSSIFQGVLVLSDNDLKRVAPDVGGLRWFLIDTSDPGKDDQTAGALETALSAFGFDTESVSQRLAGFLAVQNTYLSTFQMLGGLGLLVGTIGLAAVMLRNVLERRAEIALMLAIGFTRLRITCVIVLENTMLLCWGVVTGAAAALIAMLPHLLSTGADVPWQMLGLTLAVVLVVGSMAVVMPVRAAVKTPVREGLANG
jgi:putative ABC transport system permease protein